MQSRHTVPLTAEGIATLRQHRARQAKEKLALGQVYQDNRLVFCRVDGMSMEPRVFNYHFRRIVQQAGLPPIRLHDACHTYATLLLEQGVATKVVQSILVHTSIAITLDVYSHMSSDLEKQAAEKLNAAFTRGLL